MKRLPIKAVSFVFLLPIWFAYASSVQAQTPQPCAALFASTGSDIDFRSCEDPPVSHTYPGHNAQGIFPDHTITFRGGHLAGFFGYHNRDYTRLCGSSVFEPHLDIQFSQPASKVIVDLYNWLPEPITYTMTDNLGRTAKVAMPAAGAFPAGPTFITLLGAGITNVSITPDSMGSDSELRWEFSIADVTWIPETPSCQCGRVSAPGPHHVSGYDWGMDVEVSANDGLVLRNVMLGERYMAKEISVPYYNLRTSALLATRAELKPNSTDSEARSQLVDYSETSDGEKLVIYAVYSVDRIPAGSNSCLRITQRYEFHKAGTGCEPSERLPCSRFKPIVEYKFYGQAGETLTSFNSVQRLFFQVDGKPVNSVGLFRDCDNPFDPNRSCFGSLFELERNPLLLETFTRVIDNGSNRHTFDNLHQTYNQKVDEPGIDATVIPPSIHQKPGCPECAHVHWRWGTISSSTVFGGGPAFGEGLPLIPVGSDQSVDIAIVRWKPGEEDPRNYTNLILDSTEGLPNDIVFWYSATGHQNQDIFFTHGGFFNPAFRNATAQSGPVAVTYFNLFEDGPLTVESIDPTTVGILPDGYTVYNNLAYDITTEAEVSGPHTVSINVPSATDPEVFSSLRILHGEEDPTDPNRMILLDRTILPPDPLAANFNTKIISARVDSFSPFVIARLSDTIPPVSMATITPAPNIDEWNKTDVTVTINATDNSAVKQITYTNVLTGVATTVLDNSASFPVTFEGGNEITYYTTDKFGNAEAPKTLFVNIDKTRPVTMHNVNISGPQATITLNASDELSGVAATSYSINGSAAQNYSGPFTVTGAGSYTITYFSTDMAGNTEATQTASFTISAGPTTVTLVTIKDSFLRDGADDTNEGANERLRIQSSGHNRVLVAFDLSNISTTNLVSATLVLNIAENADNWGANGQLVDAQRLLVGWVQGNGRNDVMVGGGPGFRGTGEGATWNCAQDADISNQRADCATHWNGGSFAAATAPGVLHTRGLVGEVRWEVTADVRAGAGFGWLIKKRVEGQSGQVRYYSREGAGANSNLAPRLILVYNN